MPQRKLRRSPHQLADPVLIREQRGMGLGTLLVCGGGIGFVAYVWNIGGLQTFLDQTFREFDRSLHTHDRAVQSGFLNGLPLIGLALVAVVLYLLVAGAARKAGKARTRRKQKDHTPAAPMRPARRPPNARAPQSSDSFIRPVRLPDAKDESILVKTIKTES